MMEAITRLNMRTNKVATLEEIKDFVMSDNFTLRRARRASMKGKIGKIKEVSRH